MPSVKTLTVCAAAAVLTTSLAFAQNPQPFASNLLFPMRLTFTPAGNLLVLEGGTQTPNSGRISLVDRNRHSPKPV